MKKSLLLLFTLVSTLIVSAQSLDNEKLKKIITQLSIVALSANNGNSGYAPPADYVTDASGKITGQRFFAFDIKKYNILDISRLAENQVTLDMNNTDCPIKLTGDNLTYLKKGFTEYIVVTNEKGQVTEISTPKHPNENTRIAKVEYNADGKVTKISHGNGKSITVQKTFTHSGNTITVQLIKFKPGKGPNPKAITDQFTSIYEQQGDGFFLDQKQFGKQSFVYNSTDDLIRKTSESGTTKVESEYVFTSDRKLFKTINTTSLNGVMESKEIVIAITRDDLSKDLPNYERVSGIYKFDKTGDLIWEQNGTKYRKKENGVWSAWDYMRM
jgi:hypothetical protein